MGPSILRSLGTREGEGNEFLCLPGKPIEIRRVRNEAIRRRHRPWVKTLGSGPVKALEGGDHRSPPPKNGANIVQTLTRALVENSGKRRFESGGGKISTGKGESKSAPSEKDSMGEEGKTAGYNGDPGKEEKVTKKGGKEKGSICRDCP